MSYYNITTQHEVDSLPGSIGTYKGVIWPRDKQIFLDAGWRQVEFPNPPPEGMVPVGAPQYTPKDAETVTKSQAWETPDAADHAAQAAKPQTLKNKEKAFKDLGAQLGLTFPIQQGTLFTIAQQLMDQALQLLDENKTKEACQLSIKAQALMAMRDDLGMDVYSKYIGEGGV